MKVSAASRIIGTDSKSKESPARRILIYAVLLLTMAFVLFPFYWMIITAFKPAMEVLNRPPKMWPSHFVLENVTHALTIQPFSQFFYNSFVVTVIAVVITVFFNMLAGFAFAKYNFRFKNILFIMVLCTLMIPQQITMVPNFIIASKLHWLNSYIGLIVPQCAEAFGLFLARQFISGVPNELLEAARIDGSGEFRIFGKIILPSSRALIAVLVIFTFMWRWNDFLWPLVITNDKAYYTVQLGLAMLVGDNYVNWNDLMMVSFAAMLPVVIVFFLFQKQFVQGVTTTGMKA